SNADCSVVANNNLVVNASKIYGDANLTTLAGNNLEINAKIDLAANIQSGNDLVITAAGQVSVEDLSASNGMQLVAEAINVADIDTGGELNIASTGDVRLGTITAANAISINALTLASAEIQGGTRLNINTSGSAATSDIGVQSSVVINSSSISTGDINSRAVLDLTASNGNVASGVISAADIAIKTQMNGGSLLTNGIASGASVNWQHAGQAQLAGNINAVDNILFGCTTPECSILSNTALQLDAQNLVTDAELVTTIGNDMLINANLQASANISSGGGLRISATDGSIINSGSLAAAQNIELVSASGGDINIKGDINVGADFIVGGGGNYIHNNTGAVNIAGDWLINIHSLTNDGTLVASELADAVFRVDEFHNNGLLQSDGALDVRVDDLLENNGVITSLEGVINIGHSQPGENTKIINNNGTISAVNLSQSQQPESTLVIDPLSFVDAHVSAILSGKQLTAQNLVDTINTANMEALSELTADNGIIGGLQINADALNNNAGAQISATEISLNAASLVNAGGLIAAAENLAVNGDTVSNVNFADSFGVIAARDNIDIVLSGQLINDGVIEAADIFIDAPLQSNNSNALVTDALAGQVLSGSEAVTQVASQQWFLTAPGSDYYYQYVVAGDNNPLVNSNPTQLTDVFLAAADVPVSSLPIVGDDVYLGEFLLAAIRENGDLPFVTNDRSAIAQLRSLYGNTLSFMDSAQLTFGQMPDLTQRQQIIEPILVFQQNSLVDGTSVLAPVIIMPGEEVSSNAQAADQLSTRIYAYNQLLLKGDRITNSADLIAGNNIVIDTIDLSLTTTGRNWYVDESGEVQYRTAMINAPTMAVSIKGDYVQRGGQLISDTPLMLQANTIDIAEADVVSEVAGKSSVQAEVISKDSLYILAEERASIGSNVMLRSSGESLLRAGTDLVFAGDIAAGGDVSMLAQSIRVGSAGPNTARASVLARGNVLMQAEDDLQLSYADIRALNPDIDNAAESSLNAGRPADDRNNDSNPDVTSTGQVILLADKGNISNQASAIEADESSYMQAGGDILNQSEFANGVAQLARISAGQGGVFQVAGGNIVNTAAMFTTDGDFYQQAEGSIISRGLAPGPSEDYRKNTLNSTRPGWHRKSIIRTIDRVAIKPMRNMPAVTVAPVDTIIAAGAITQIAGDAFDSNATHYKSDSTIVQQANDIRLKRSTYTSGGETSLIAGNSINVNTVKLDAADNLNMFATTGDISVTSSLLTALGDMTLSAGNSVVLTDSKLNARKNTANDAQRYTGLDTGELVQTGGNLILVAQAGDIVNNAGDLSAEHSGYMKAGGNIINSSEQAVVSGPVRYKSSSENYSVEINEELADDYYRHTVERTRVTNTTTEGQHVQTDAASITTGDGGLVQIAGGNINNAGGIVASAGDIYQQAVGSISNTAIAKQYIKSKTTTNTSTVFNDFEDKRNNGESQAGLSTTTTVGGVAVQAATTSAGGNLTQVAGKDIYNTASKFVASGDIYQKADGDVFNASRSIDSFTSIQLDLSLNRTHVPGSGTSVANAQQLHIATTSAGGNHIVEAENGKYSNTGNISAGRDINIVANDIVNTRLARNSGSMQQSETKVHGSGYYATTDTIVTTTSGRKQVLDTGRVEAGGNVVLNAANKIIDTAGRYQAGINGPLKDAEGNDRYDATGNALQAGIYADATNGIDFKNIEWTETDAVQKIQSYMDSDYGSEDDVRVTRTADIGYNTRDMVVTGNLRSAGSTSLRSELGDVNLAATDIHAGQQIALEGRNINLDAVGLKDEQYRHQGRTTTQHYEISNDLVNLNAQSGIALTTTGDKTQAQGNLITQGAMLSAGDDISDHIVL
ncbi:MAG: hypothetical protein WBN96_03540, partial [Gammaproteobacteria bacterium]